MLSELLPHADPMVLLTGYEEPSDEFAQEATVEVTEESPFYDSALGGVPGCVALEYMAQTMALCIGIHRRKQGLAPKLGFVLGSRRLDVSVEAFVPGVRYRVRTVCTYQDDEFGSFDCEITDGDGRLAAMGTVTAFQPSGELTAEKMKEYM